MQKPSITGVETHAFCSRKLFKPWKLLNHVIDASLLLELGKSKQSLLITGVKGV
jgi:hypothetical protein